ncbi:MAG TPA: AAA family ATPase [Polyangiales bacterium]|nr:AAA family ATPase [Polyangiales bacterium]
MVQRWLGSGGSGEVYCAADANHARQVALKLLPRATMERRPDYVRALQREYHRLQLLRHPRIVEVYEYGSDAAGIYYTMELIEGPDLKSSMPLEWRRTCLVLRDIALSLAIVHSRRLVHRDVGPGNVRCGRDGRAKLLDFGATVSSGIPCSVVGTPPCTPPEALEHAPLDARADLFGLGALGYCLLTGVHAYPASAFSQLAALWDGPLNPPSALVPDIPKALDQLIVALLQRDRLLRPRSATEVISHLEAIADLQPVPISEAAQTSFVAPALVGRLPELDLLGCHAAAARKGKGGLVLVEGAPGQGRTRLLQQFVVEVSQPDVLVAAADTSRGASQGYETCLALCEAIQQQATDLPAEALREHERVVSLVPQLRRSAQPGELTAAHRQSLQRALRDALFGLARHVTLIVLVDDLQHCDEPSAALLASLAASAHEQRLLIVATKQTGAPVLASSAVQALTQHATRVLLKPLDARAIESLVRSAFFDAPHSKFVSDWVGSLSEGNPGKIVELLRHLVEHDLVEFRDGAWVLPEYLDPALLPHDVAAALRERIQSLSSGTRELAELVCVFVRPATFDDLRALVAGEDDALLSALDELTAADVIASDGRTFAVSRLALRDILLKGLDAQQLQRAHLRVGRALARDFHELRYDRTVDLPTAYLWSLAGYHLLLGGERERGARLWLNSLRYALEIDYVPMWDGNMWYLEANLLALQAAEELGMSRRTIASLRTGVVQSALHGDPRMAAYGERTLPELERAAGLLDYEACAHISDPVARSLEALGRAERRWSETPAALRGMQPYEAILLLVPLTFSMACIYHHTFNARELAKLPGKLTPFVALAPSCGVFQQLIEAIHASVTGRTDRELALRLQSLAGFESESMRSTVNDTLRSHLRGFTLYTIATVEAVRNPARGLARVAQMEAETPFMTFATWQIRLLAHVYEGNASEAQACAERMEITALQDGAITKYQLHACGLQYLSAAYALSGDVMGLKATIDKLGSLGQSLDSWQPYYDAARAEYHRLRGQLTQARALAERAIANVRAGEHRGYAFAQLTALRVLLDAEEYAAAHALAERALEQTRAHELGPELESQLCALDALALARSSSMIAARVRGERALAIADQAQFAGLLAGELHYALAQVALLDCAGREFERHAAAVARYTCAHQHPVLMARYKRLLAEATAAGLVFSVVAAGGASLVRHTDLRAELLAELNRKSVARSLPQRVLELMLERSGVSAGFLFGLEGSRLRLLAPSDVDAPAGLTEAVQTCFAAERAVANRDPLNTLTATLTSVVRADNGQLFQVAVLHVRNDDGSVHASGALALRVHEEIPAIPRWDYIFALSAVLDRRAAE